MPYTTTNVAVSHASPHRVTVQASNLFLILSVRHVTLTARVGSNSEQRCFGCWRP